jgi:hypothetical protein
MLLKAFTAVKLYPTTSNNIIFERYKESTFIGHSQWSWPWLVPMGAGQVLSVDARVVVALRD